MPASVSVRVVCGDVRRGAAAHRLAADEETLARARRPRRARSVDRRAIARDELRHAIGNLAPLLCVEKVERQHVEPALAQRAREADHERMLLRRACAVREDERRRAGASTPCAAYSRAVVR